MVFDFLVSGHPRSGTQYMANLFQSFGYDVGHEKMGKDGIASWMFAVHSTNVPYTADVASNKGRYWKNVIHVVREPLATLSSVIYTENDSLEARRAFVWISKDADPITQAIQSLVGWSKLVKAWDPDLVVKVEYAPVKLAEYLSSRGYKVPQNPALPATSANSRQHAKLTLEEIKSTVSWAVYDEFMAWCTTYQYPLA